MAQVIIKPIFIQPTQQLNRNQQHGNGSPNSCVFFSNIEIYSINSCEISISISISALAVTDDAPLERGEPPRGAEPARERGGVRPHPGLPLHGRRRGRRDRGVSDGGDGVEGREGEERDGAGVGEERVVVVGGAAEADGPQAAAVALEANDTIHS